jgi:hypothetical protein
VYRTTLLLRSISLESVNAVYLYCGCSLPRKTANLGNVQRLFATFPEHGPGIALLLLRISVAATVWLVTSAHTMAVARDWILPGLVLVSVFLCIGFLVPIVSVLCCLFELASLLSSGADGRFILVSIVNAAALALLGPGAYSLDARLFGRRTLVVSARKGREGL